MAVSQWSRAVIQIFKGAYGEWSLCAGHAVMYSVVCIDAFLRIFSTSHTGLW
ncbi:hypothetical protein GAP32_411 [Cronobacter phage vB_CsaM_GAP32]|uniref:Uncharacterized protein n=1 Tax=Cronobacter phage vB_CsaM_GAP32 TaxID=1141136 RepID=K4FB77_9CAUD|nr:hypothetical protein GAP32_411 [Cronobacter phage vB_CsaM_GAP32]AFC21864.1 hypothetical protein GAP32_411 [Cronobacter phage vB_CsaM_GAP32]